jgi:phosphoribosylaminoimidazole (AIR) synthetase
MLVIEEMFRTFNCGIGMVLIVRQNNVERVKQLLGEQNECVYELGHLVPASEGGPSVRFV